MTGFQYPAVARIFSPCHHVQTDWGPSSFLSNRY